MGQGVRLRSHSGVLSEQCSDALRTIEDCFATSRGCYAGGPHIEPPLLSAALARCPSELADVSMAWLLQLPRRKHVVASQLIELFAGEPEKARKHLSGVRICS